MARIFVDFCELENIDNDITSINGVIYKEKENINDAICKLDWEVRCQPIISRRSKEIIKKLDRIVNCLRLCNDYIMYSYTAYDKLDNYEEILELKNKEAEKHKKQKEEEERRKQEKQKFIDEFEKKNPDIKKQFDKFLNSGGEYNNLTDDEKREIKYRAYTADEPARTIFLRNLEKLNIRTTDTNTDKRANDKEKGTAFYKPAAFRHDISFIRTNNDNDSFGGNSNDKYDYATVYHESGHCIDDLADLNGWNYGFDTSNYKAKVKICGQEKEISVYDAIIYDVYYNKENQYSLINFYNNYNKNKETSFEDFKNSLMKGDSSWNEIYGETYRNFIYGDNIDKSGKNGSLNGVSDIYGGATQNIGEGNTGHTNDYWNTLEKQKVNLPAEAWAEYFEGSFIQDKTYLENMKKYLPTTCTILDSYADDLSNKSKKINI